MARDLRWAVGHPWGPGPILTPCPDPTHGDDDPSCAVWHDHAHCFGCRRHFTAAEFLVLLRVNPETLPETNPRLLRLGRQEAEPPSDTLVGVWQQTLLDPRSPRHHRLDYLRDRGLRYATLQRARLGHTGRQFAIPVISRRGLVLGVKFRRDDAYCDPDAPKYMAPRGQPPLLYRPKPGGWPRVICEGELDALLLSQYGVDAITTTGGASSLAPLLRGWPGKAPLYILTDDDEAGDRAATSLADTLRVPIRRVASGAHDVTDALRGLTDGEVLTRLRRWFGTGKAL